MHHLLLYPGHHHDPNGLVTQLRHQSCAQPFCVTCYAQTAFNPGPWARAVNVAADPFLRTGAKRGCVF